MVRIYLRLFCEENEFEPEEAKPNENGSPQNEAENQEAEANEAEMSAESSNEACEQAEEKQEEETCSEERVCGYSEHFARLEEKLEELNGLFEKKLLMSQSNEKIIDNMHRELEDYKKDFYGRLIKPLIMDIIEVRSNIVKMADNYGKKPEEEQSIPLKTFISYAWDLEGILENYDVEIYRSSEGDSFKPIRQKAIKTVYTSDPELDKKIAESYGEGYVYNGKVVSGERVSVYVYKPAEEADENSNDSENKNEEE